MRYPGAGAVYSVPCEALYHTPDFPIWSGLEVDAEDVIDDSISLRENLSLLSCIVQPEQTEAVSRAAMQVGAHGPVVFYCEGRGLRDRLGWLRITKKRTKEVVTLLLDNADAPAVVSAIQNAARLEMPGRGFLYRMPVHKGIVSLATTTGSRHYAADMQQIISAIDDLMGHSDWRRRSVVRLGSGAQAAGIGLDDEDVVSAPKAYTRLTFIAGQAHTPLLLDAALEAGAPGANVMSSRFVEAESRVAMGRRLNRERNWLQIVVPMDRAHGVLQSVMQAAQDAGVTEACFFSQPVSQVVTYQARTVSSRPQQRTYRGALIGP